MTQDKAQAAGATPDTADMHIALMVARADLGEIRRWGAARYIAGYDKRKAEEKEAAAPQAAGAVSQTDTPSLETLIKRFWATGDTATRDERLAEIMVEIDAHAAQRYEAGKAEQTELLKKCAEVDQAEFNRKWVEQKERADNSQGMADCMDMVRQELVEAGIIGKEIAPMFIANAVVAHCAARTRQDHGQALTVTHALMAERDAAKASLARLVEGGSAFLQYLDDHEWGGVVEGETALRFRTLLLAKAEACTDPAACDAQGCMNPKGRCAEAVPAPAMGEELPPRPSLPETRYNGCGDGSEPLYTPDMMDAYALDYGRACMALRPPGAELSETVVDHCWKMYQQGQASADHTAKEVFAGTLQSLVKWLGNPTPAAPVSQPAAQEPVARLHIRDDDDGISASVEVLNGEFLQPEHSPVNVYLAPQPLSAPAGSEQDRAKFLQWFTQHYADPNVGNVETSIQRHAAWAAWQAANKPI